MIAGPFYHFMGVGRPNFERPAAKSRCNLHAPSNSSSTILWTFNDILRFLGASRVFVNDVVLLYIYTRMKANRTSLEP